MDIFWTIQWEHPEVLWGLLILPLLSYLLWHDWHRKRHLVQRWSQVTEVIRQSALPSPWREAGYAGVLLTGVGLAVAGFASPALPTVTWEPAWERVAVGLLLDVSASMRAPVDAHDTTAASRLDMLKQAVQELLAHLPPGVRVGVVAFAGVAVPLIPEPSADHQAVMAKVRRLDQTFIANPGSNLAAAIQQGLTLFVDTTLGSQPDTVSLLLLGDGDSAITRQLRTVLQGATLPIFTLGIGTLQPVHIPDTHSPTGVLTDHQGLPVTTAVNETVLRLIAAQTGGTYYPFTQRATLVRTLRQIVTQQGQQVTQPVPRPRSARRACFLASFCCLFVYQFHTRPRRLRRRPGKRQASLV